MNIVYCTIGIDIVVTIKNLWCKICPKDRQILCGIISGSSALPKFRITKLCFRLKCASEFQHGTQAPPSETICKIVDGEEVCSQNQFNAVGGVVSIFIVMTCSLS